MIYKQWINQGLIIIFLSIKLISYVFSFQGKTTERYGFLSNHYDCHPPLFGHSTTTWTQFYKIMTPSPLEWTFYIIPTLCHLTKRGLSTDPLPPLLVNVVTEWPLWLDETVPTWILTIRYCRCKVYLAIIFWKFVAS